MATEQCTHTGEIEIRVIGVTDDIYTVDPVTRTVSMDCDLSEDGEQFLRVRCLDCERQIKTYRWEWEKSNAVPGWAKRALRVWRDRANEITCPPHVGEE